MSRSLDCFLHHSLMFGAGSRSTTGNDLAALAHQFMAKLARSHLLVIHRRHFVHTEDADFATRTTELIVGTAPGPGAFAIASTPVSVAATPTATGSPGRAT